MHNSFPVRANLLRRNIHCIPSCPWCDDGIESELHLFRECPWTIGVWSQSPLGTQYLSAPTSSVGEWIDGIMNNAAEENISLFFALCYELWQARNKNFFEQREAHLPTLFHRALNANSARASSINLIGFRSTQATVQADRWPPPPNGYFKINSDAAHAAGEVWGIGIIIWNNSGEVLAAATRRVSTFPDPGLAEALGIRLAIEFAKDMCFDNVILEYDCKVVTDLFSSSQLAHSYTGMIVQDCLALSVSFRSFQVMHTRRAGNMCAHLLAKYACSYLEDNWIEDIPICIAPALAQDIYPRSS
ncbi:Ribonuclease H-like superfamily [Sesbania bispinosa]|nr:Ribonuclease H-like superfamily [Sesbania bispinosa]